MKMLGCFFCNFIEPSYPILNYIYEEMGGYRDIVALYKLWNTRRKLSEVNKDITRLENENAKLTWDLAAFYWKIIKMLPLIFYKWLTIRKDEEAKKSFIKFGNNFATLQNARKDFNMAVRVNRDSRKRYKKLEKKFAKRIKDYKPLGL